MSLEVGFRNADADENMIATSLQEMLQNCDLLALSTTGPAGAHINTAYYAFTPDLRLVIFTPSNTQHAENVRSDPRVAVAVYRTDQPVGAELKGLQLFGRMVKAEIDSDLTVALETYGTRFPWLREAVNDPHEIPNKFESRLYIITTEKVKIFDESRFGKEVWACAELVS